MRKYITGAIASLWIASSHGIPEYFCTAANYRYYPFLLNLIGSIHKSQYNDLAEMAVFDLGLTPDQKRELALIEKVKLYTFESGENPYILAPFMRDNHGSWVPGWYAWKYIALRRVLQDYPYVLWIDAGSTVLRPLDDLFAHIAEHGYFLSTIGDGLVHGCCEHNVGWGATRWVRHLFQLDIPQNAWVLEKESVMGGIQGVARHGTGAYLDTMCLLTQDMRNFEDDGSTPNGFGTGRHDQPLLGALAYLKKLTVAEQDHTQQVPMALMVKGKKVDFHMTHMSNYVDTRTHIYSSRGDIQRLNEFIRAIRIKPGVPS